LRTALKKYSFREEGLADLHQAPVGVNGAVQELKVAQNGLTTEIEVRTVEIERDEDLLDPRLLNVAEIGENMLVERV